MSHGRVGNATFDRRRRGATGLVRWLAGNGIENVAEALNRRAAGESCQSWASRVSIGCATRPANMLTGDRQFADGQIAIDNQTRE